MWAYDAIIYPYITQTYDAFGNPTTQTGSESSNVPFRFSTKYLGTEASLYYYGRRYYSPELGRWPSRDPIGEEGGLNVYGFVGNQSVNYTDLLGLDWSDPERQGGPRAEVTCKPCDTVKDLADKVGLSADEYRKWLQPVGDAVMPESALVPVGGSYTYTVPNVVAWTIGDVRAQNGFPAAHGTQQQTQNIVTHVSQKYTGLKVRRGSWSYSWFGHNRGDTLEEIRDILKSPDLYIWVHGGHGADDQSGRLRIYDAAKQLYLVSPAGLPVNHKLAEVYLYVCYAAKGSWRSSQVAPSVNASIPKFWGSINPVAPNLPASLSWSTQITGYQ